MREQVLRAATLCFFGNEYLRLDDDASLTEVYLKACFKGVERLEFVRPNAHQLAAPGTGFVRGSKTWFRRLKADGVEQLRLHLPISLLEPLPSEFGLVTDGFTGSDLWLPVDGSSRRNVEYDAHRYAMWSLPRLAPAATSFASMIQGIAALNEGVRGMGTPLAKSAAHLAGILSHSSQTSSAFDDSIPGSFDQTRKVMAKAAIHTVVALTEPGLGIEEQPTRREAVDVIWKLALRVLEGLSVEPAEEVAAAAVA